MKETLESSINRGNENYEAYIATGGKDSEYIPVLWNNPQAPYLA